MSYQNIVDPKKLTVKQIVSIMSDLSVELGTRAEKNELNGIKPTAIIVDEVRVKTQQEIRDESIQFAKDSLEKLSVTRYYDGQNNKCYIARDTYRCSVEFIVNKEKRTVVALLKGVSSKSTYSRGVAKCDPNDCFNVHIGKAIALYRALGKVVPAELLEAPQPTEAKHGDIVEYEGKIRKAIENRREAYRMGVNAHLGSTFVKDGKIIDDSKE